MSNTIDTEAAAASAGSGRSSAGAALKAAREAAGLSVDAVAHQLKLAPRQVKALEDDDYQRLPGRTFVRGFARNYARFVQLDPDTVVGLMPTPESAPALERPALAASRRPMGEIPTLRATKPSASRWLIPLLLLAIVVIAGFYEYARSPSGFLRQLLSPSGTPAASRAPAPAGAASASGNVAAPLAVSPASVAGTTTTALRNPVIDSSAPGTSPGKEAPATDATSAAPGAGTAGAAVNASGAATAAGTPGDASLVLTFRDTSWVEVKDANGRLVLQMTGGPGMTQTVSAVPPLELALGNAPDVAVTFRGQLLDLAPYTRGNVARVALK